MAFISPANRPNACPQLLAAFLKFHTLCCRELRTVSPFAPYRRQEILQEASLENGNALPHLRFVHVLNPLLIALRMLFVESVNLIYDKHDLTFIFQITWSQIRLKVGTSKGLKSSAFAGSMGTQTLPVFGWIQKGLFSR